MTAPFGFFLARLWRDVALVLAAAIPLLLVQCAADSEPPDPGRPAGGRPAVVPDEADPGGWESESDPRVFEGEDLFVYINGGAEIYYEYGFRKVTIQEYRGDCGRAITLEIYEMADDRSAFGIYSMKTGDKGKAVPVGGGGLIESYYMNFWKGNRLVTLTGFDDHPETVAGLKAIAGAVDEVIGGQGRKPRLVEALRKGDQVDGSIKYLLGPLGLFNACPLVSGKIFGFSEAAAADFDGGYRVILFRYADAVQCGAGFESLGDRFANHPGTKGFTSDNQSFSLFHQEGKSVHGRLAERCIIVVVDAPNRISAEGLFHLFEKRTADPAK